jgi:hypothetical protein
VAVGLVVVLEVGVGVVVVVAVGVGVGVLVGVAVGVGVGEGEFCAAVGWVWAKLDVAVLGDAVGELDLLGCADADADTFDCSVGPVWPGGWLRFELSAVAAEADAATITAAAAAATQASRRRFPRRGEPAGPPSTPPASAAVTGCVAAAGWLGWPPPVTPFVGGAAGVPPGGGESWVPNPAAATRPDGEYRPTTSVSGGGSQSSPSWPASSSARRSPGVGR